jgi:hypothetical protein
MCTTFSLFLFIGVHLDCFHILAVNNGVEITACHSNFTSFGISKSHPCSVFIYLFIYEISLLFCNGILTVCKGSLMSTSSPALSHFDNRHSYQVEVIFDHCLICISVISDVEHFQYAHCLILYILLGKVHLVLVSYCESDWEFCC